MTRCSVTLVGLFASASMAVRRITSAPGHTWWERQEAWTGSPMPPPWRDSLKAQGWALRDSTSSIATIAELKAACARKPYLVFVHVPKTGGTSVVDAFTRCTPQLNDRLISITTGRVPDRLHHHTAAQYSDALALQHNASLRDDAFSIAWIREPYSMMVSLCYYLMTIHGPMCRELIARNSANRSVVLDGDGVSIDLCHDWAAAANSNTHDLQTWTSLFSRWLISRDRLFPSDSNLNWQKFTSTGPTTQVGWLSDGLLPASVSLVAKLDGPTRQDELWRQIVAACIPECEHAEIRHAKSTWHPSSYDHYVGRNDLAEIIERRFAADFETFGYPRRPWEGLPRNSSP